MSEPLTEFSGAIYTSLDAFYDADDRRRLSPEWDYGVHWRPEHGDWPLYRVSWVVETGDLYAFQTGSRGRVYVLGNVPRVGEYPYGEAKGFNAWGEFKNAQPIEKLLEGWAEVMPPQLTWVTQRLDEYRPEP